MIKKFQLWAMNLAKKSLAFRNVARKSLYIVQTAKYRIKSVIYKVDDKTILFSCFAGQSYADSPKAIYEYMLKNEKYKEYKFVWIFNEPDKYDFLENNRNTIIIKRKGNLYQKFLHTAKYLIFNFKIPEYIIPKKSQVFVQCWHGTPLKRLGCDLIHYDNAMNTVEGMKKRYRIEAKRFSYLISPSKYCTEKFISAWDLKKINKENIIIEKGYPRNDFLYTYTEKDVESIKRKILDKQYAEYKKNPKKIILYAPTFRANQYETGVGYIYKEEVDFDKLRKALGNEYIILFRPHYFVANAFNFDKYESFVYNVSEVDDVNELYIISDILITDYSSVFFDYANLKKPIIFYMYDLEHYRDESNGFYFDVEKELPGKIVRTDDEVIEEIIRVTKEFEYDEKYREFNEKFNYLDDGHASKRVIEQFMEENK